MPSQLPVIPISALVAAFHRGVKGKRDKRADDHTGSAYDYIAGTSAMLLARMSTFTRDLFRADYFDQAESDDLTALVAGRYQIPRILDTYGPGTATLLRPNAAADAGLSQTERTLWEGTRVIIQSQTTSGLVYAVAADTPIASGALYVAGLPIRAVAPGLGAAINTAVTGQRAALGDPTWDPSWQVGNVTCADGTVFEQAADFRARVRALVLASQPGYETAIVNAAVAAGAVNVAVFGTNYGGIDLHSCATYIGDAGFGATLALVNATKVGLERSRMLGAEMLIAPMAPAPLPIAAVIQLYDDPSKFDTDTIATACVAAIRGVLGASGAYGYDSDAFFGAVVGISPAIQDATFTLGIGGPPLGSKTLLVHYPPPSGVLWFPQTLTRYQTPASGITITFTGP